MKAQLMSLVEGTIFYQLVFGISIWQWAGLLTVILGSLLLSTLISWVINAVILKKSASYSFFPSIQTHLQNNQIQKPLNLIIVGWLGVLGVASLGINQHVLSVLAVSAKVLTYSGITWLGWNFSSLLNDVLTFKAAKTKTKYDDLLAPLISRTIKIFAITFGLVSISDILDLPIQSLLAGVGIGGIAIAMAAKDTISNLFGSLTILIDRPFNIGDWIVIGEHEGTVEDVGFRSTRIRTFYDSLIIIPNSQILNLSVDNMGKRTYRRLKCTLSVTYETPAEKLDALCEGIRTLIREHPSTRKDYYLVHFTSYAASSLDVMVYCFLKVPGWKEELEAKQELFLGIKRLAETLPVEFAYPTQTMLTQPSREIQPTVSGDLSSVSTETKHAADSAKKLAQFYK